jgi:hypothetical protein
MNQTLKKYKMKFCIDCRHYLAPVAAQDEQKSVKARCAALIATPLKLNLVDGTAIAPTFRFCDSARSTNFLCGEFAKLFQPKTTHAEIQSVLKEMYKNKKQ